jgi:hypothetical protein
MGARPTSRTRSRNAKFRRRRRSSAKLSGKLRPPMIANKETTDVERTPSLLLSSLRYWEVERDLIDEWLAVRQPYSEVLRQQRKECLPPRPRTVSPRRNRCRSCRARRSFCRSFHHRLVPEGCGKIKNRRP